MDLILARMNIKELNLIRPPAQKIKTFFYSQAFADGFRASFTILLYKTAVDPARRNNLDRKKTDAQIT